ncbi:MAG: hypothetical protein M1321_01280 [Candidatus Marsarchaeota archaeon]|nr:hypothetical protein [Candidatus Marsarchaeota archaeon]
MAPRYSAVGRRRQRPVGRDVAVFFAAVLLVLVATVYIRTLMLSYPGFFEPDGFYNYAVIRYAVAHNLTVPQRLPLSGWPSSAQINEPSGLYWITLIPYAVLQHIGIGYSDIMRFVPVLFGILDVIGAYYLSRFISRDRIFGLLVMALVGLSVADATKTMALSYRGDGFVTIFLILALISMALAINERRRAMRIAYALGGAFALSLCSLVWNGAGFALAVYSLSFMLIAAYAFIAAKKGILARLGYVAAGLYAWFLLVTIYNALGYIPGQHFQALTGPGSVAIPSALLLGWLFLLLMLGKEGGSGIVSRPAGRLAALAVIMIAGTASFYILAYGFLYSTLSSEGLVHAQNGLLRSIGELDAPTFQYLLANFNAGLFMSPMGIAMALSAAFPGIMVIFFMLLLAGSAFYAFTRVDGSGGWLGGRACLSLDIRPEMLMMAAYLAVAAFLQMTADRFSSLVAVPLAVFSAYTLYVLLLFIKRHGTPSARAKLYLLSGIIIAALFMVILRCAAATLTAATPLDYTYPYLLSAAAWLNSGTPLNSTVLAFWPDGSVVEGWGNRTSVMDSVGAQDLHKTQAFASWLFNTSDDPGFLLGSAMGKPDYLLVRQYWIYESASILTETDMSNSSSQAYVSESLGVVNQSWNGTSFEATLAGNGIYGSIKIYNGTIASSLFEYKSGAAQYIIPLGSVSFYNAYTGNFQIQAVQGRGAQYGQMLLLLLAPANGSRSGLGSVAVTGAYIMSASMADSNLVKLAYFCNSRQCAWNNSVAGLRLVYPNNATGYNPDVKIFRIIYRNGG